VKIRQEGAGCIAGTGTHERPATQTVTTQETAACQPQLTITFQTTRPATTFTMCTMPTLRLSHLVASSILNIFAKYRASHRWGMHILRILKM